MEIGPRWDNRRVQEDELCDVRMGKSGGCREKTSERRADQHHLLIFFYYIRNTAQTFGNNKILRSTFSVRDRYGV